MSNLKCVSLPLLVTPNAVEDKLFENKFVFGSYYRSMHLYFIDDSGDPSRSTTHFVLGGVVIPADQWHKLNNSFSYACEKFKVHGEIKWRLFGIKPSPGDRKNPISHLSFEEKDELRKLLFESLVKFNSVKIITSVVHTLERLMIMDW